MSNSLIPESKEDNILPEINQEDLVSFEKVEFKALPPTISQKAILQNRRILLGRTSLTWEHIKNRKVSEDLYQLYIQKEKHLYQQQDRLVKLEAEIDIMTAEMNNVEGQELNDLTKKFEAKFKMMTATANAVKSSYQQYLTMLDKIGFKESASNSESFMDRVGEGLGQGIASMLMSSRPPLKDESQEKETIKAEIIEVKSKEKDIAPDTTEDSILNLI